MNQIANLSTSHRLQISPEDRAALRDAKNSLVGDELTRPLLPAVRERLSGFLARTESHATPATDSQIDDEISMLMLSYTRARTISSAEADATVAAYTSILRGQPLWAIRAGFHKVKHNEVEDLSPDFPPSAPRLLKVVTDEMIPLRADRVEVQRILSARDGLPDNPDLARRAKEAAKSGLNAMQVKYGPSYGLGGVLPANEIGVAPPPPRPEFKALQGQALVDHYARHNFAFQPKPNVDRNDGRNGDETFHDGAGRRRSDPPPDRTNRNQRVRAGRHAACAADFRMGRSGNAARRRGLSG